MDGRLSEMIEAMSHLPPEVAPSKYWVELNRRNLDQLERDGYGNFKRTLARNYFTWLPGLNDPQIRFLVRSLPFAKVVASFAKAAFSRRQEGLAWTRSVGYSFLTLMLWDYASRREQGRILDVLSEPIEGNPPSVYQGEKLVSQDLANSSLEFMSMMNHGLDQTSIQTIIELGAGYGRTAFVFLRLLPSIRYWIVDIPPALYVAERYLSSQFGDRVIFRFRTFDDFSEIERELTSASIAFFLPSQLRLLPPKCGDLFVNISSLHEMRPEQISYYLGQIDRLTTRYCYLKQWKVSRIPLEEIVVREGDYPIPGGWSQVYWRECKVQTEFFEALFELR